MICHFLEHCFLQYYKWHLHNSLSGSICSSGVLFTKLLPIVIAKKIEFQYNRTEKSAEFCIAVLALVKKEREKTVCFNHFILQISSLSLSFTSFLLFTSVMLKVSSKDENLTFKSGLSKIQELMNQKWLKI